MRLWLALDGRQLVPSMINTYLFDGPCLRVHPPISTMTGCPRDKSRAADWPESELLFEQAHTATNL